MIGNSESRDDDLARSLALTAPGEENLLHDRLYDQIPLGPSVQRLIATPSFVRLEGIRQLGFVAHQWPGATHTRYEHSLGCYFLARQTIHHLVHWYPQLDAQAALAFQLASLLHDIGHYGYAHALEEIGDPFPHHEQVGRTIIEQSELATLLERDYHLCPGRVADLIDPANAQGGCADDALLRGLLSGSLDVDKLDYLPRDAKACHVPYGHIDALYLLACLRVAFDPTGQPLVALAREGIGALASFLHARQEMYLSVYRHVHNRACQAMLRRAVQDALLQKTITAPHFTTLNDTAVLTLLADKGQPFSTQALAQALTRQNAYRLQLEISPLARHFPLLAERLNDVWCCRRIEQKVADAVGALLGQPFASHEILLDFPRSKRWDMDGWICTARSLIGSNTLIPWSQALGLRPDDLSRCEDARRPIRLFLSAHVAERIQVYPTDQIHALVEECILSTKV